MTYPVSKSRKKSLAKVQSSIRQNEFTYIAQWSIHCNSIPSSWSVIHSDAIGTYRCLSHTVLSCTVSCVRISEQDVWCWWLTGTDYW